MLILSRLCIFSPAQAACTVSGTTNSTFNYTAANINSDATVNLSGTITCTNLGLPQISNFMCMKTVFTGATTANNSVTLPYTVTATVGGLALLLPTKPPMCGMVQ